MLKEECLTLLFFLLIITFVEVHEMDKERLKLIIRNLESLVDCLKSEVYSDVDSYMNYEDIVPHITDYDEIFEDDDGYPD
jgi:hypothetical protein